MSSELNQHDVRKAIAEARRVVIKLGSAVLTDADAGLVTERIEALEERMKDLEN